MVKPVKATKKQTIVALCTLALGLSAGCSVFTAGETVSEPDLTVAKATRATADAKQREARGLPPQPADAHGAKQAAAMPEVKETVTASHILIAYQGARAASATTTRSKEQAQKLAEEIAQKVKKPG